MATKRMPKAERRKQLLEIASRIVREEGTDALTLQVLAEKAGVTKPIPYDHFGSRDGLLIALYRSLDETQMEAARDVIAGSRGGFKATVRLLAESYVDCCLKAGPVFYAILAALEGNAEMQAVKQELRGEYFALMRKALSPAVKIPTRDAALVGAAILGAADAAGVAAVDGSASRDTAVRVLADMMAGALAPYKKS